MEKYEFFRPMSNGDFSRRVEEVYVCLTEYLATELSERRHLQYAKVFLSDIQNQEPVFKSSDLYKKVLSAKPLTIIEQPPADGSKITVLVKTSSSLADFVFSPMRLSADEARGLDSYAQTKTDVRALRTQHGGARTRHAYPSATHMDIRPRHRCQLRGSSEGTQ